MILYFTDESFHDVINESAREEDDVTERQSAILKNAEVRLPSVADLDDVQGEY